VTYFSKIAAATVNDHPHVLPEIFESMSPEEQQAHAQSVVNHQLSPRENYVADAKDTWRRVGGLVGGVTGGVRGWQTSPVGGLIGLGLGTAAGVGLGHLAGGHWGNEDYEDAMAYREQMQDRLKRASFISGADAALAKLGMDKEAILGALGAGMRAGLSGLRAGAGLAKGVQSVGGVSRAQHAMNLGKAGIGAARAGGQAFAQAAPGVAKGLQTAGKVMMHPATQVAAVAAPAVLG
jgi:hypothetical protein